MALAAVGNCFDTYAGRWITFHDSHSLAAMADVLKTIHDMVTIAEGQQYVTCAYLPCLYLLCMEALSPLDNEMEDDALLQFKLICKKHLRRRLGYLVEKPNLALAAAALHPCFCGLTFISSGEKGSSKPRYDFVMLLSNRFTRSSLALHHQRSMRIL